MTVIYGGDSNAIWGDNDFVLRLRIKGGEWRLSAPAKIKGNTQLFTLGKAGNGA